MQQIKDISYNITPQHLTPGMQRWITATIKNTGRTDLQAVSIRLNSLDSQGIDVTEASRYIGTLKQGATTTERFLVNAMLPTHIYLSIDGFKQEKPFIWEGAPRRIQVGEEPASLINLFADEKKRIMLGDMINVEATVKSKETSDELTLDYTIQSPSDDIIIAKSIPLEPIEPGKVEVVKDTTKTEEEGIYTVRAYLYDGNRRIGSATDHVLVAG